MQSQIFTKEEVEQIFSEFSINEEIIEVLLIPAGWEVNYFT
jgi:hypothetical protein